MLGRYELLQEIASGGVATVYLGRFFDSSGAARAVAIKRLHPQYARDPEFVSMFLDEARVATRINHPNVVSILDVGADDGELFLVMEYVRGESLSRLQQLAAHAKRPIPLPIISAILIGALAGLHAAHEARDERGESLKIVHRDVSPQNLLVGADGVTRLLDFGIAKAVGRRQTTREGQFKGKLSYMSREQVLEEPVDRRTDVYAAGVVLYALLTGALPFQGTQVMVLYQIAHTKAEPPRSLDPSISPELDALVMRAMSALAVERFATAYDLAVELARIAPPAPAYAVGAWLQETTR
jgi:eukaryotic-like serine/threonine-protein kinase